MVEILIYCHNFQRRLCWVLSSISQQVNTSLDYVVNIASLKNNGNPTTEDVISYFRKHLNIKHTIFDDKKIFAYPSFTKNRQIQESNADWIICHSCDHVLNINHLSSIERYITGRYQNHNRLLGSNGNMCTIIEPTNDIINSTEKMFINNAYDRAMQIPQNEIIRLRGPGGYLIFRRKTILEKCSGYYIHPRKNRDRHLFDHGMLSRSDLIFRRNMGGTKMIKLPRMIHLNHYRDKELGYHTEEQR